MEQLTRDQIRSSIANSFLHGYGAEIGAGVTPHAVPASASVKQYDVRTSDELKLLFGESEFDVSPVHQIQQDFPSGCDFLIAHNVLEHSPDPIGTLASWHSRVRPNGTLVISLPDRQLCPDDRRVVASLDHLLLDFACNRNHLSFESKEHIPAFILGWLQQMWVKDFPGDKLADFVLSEQNRNEGHDLHWHAFTPTLAMSTVIAACIVGGHGAKLLSFAHPHGDRKTLGDIIVVYKLYDSPFDGFLQVPSDVARTLADLNLAFSKLQTLHETMQRLTEKQTAA